MPWVPFAPADTLVTYAAKMSAQIPGDDPIIMGVSFGGMLASEIAKMRPVQKAILISSAKVRAEVGYHSPLYAMLHKVVPAWCFGRTYWLLLYRLGARTREERMLLAAMLRDSSRPFGKWATRAILNWKSTDCTDNILQLHGTADKVIAAANVQPDHWIAGGSHIMVYNRAGEVSEVVRKALAQ